MPVREVSPRKVQEAVGKGFDNLANFRKARLMFLRAYVGQYYNATNGDIGTEALNLIFNAVRVLVPNIVTNFPKHTVVSRFLASRDYAELLTLALNYQGQVLDLKSKYRRAITDAVFTLGILKTGLAESDSVYAFDEYNKIDAGTVYTECVDFDNFVVDPNSRDHLFKDAAYMGDRICVPRSSLLDSGLYRNDLIEQLPTVGDEHSEKRAENLGHRTNSERYASELNDEVEIIELWVPDANALLTIPGSKDTVFDQYLREDDYYGPDTGPYTLLGLTPPVPSNPLPVPAVGIWYDLHVLANRLASKIINQAERQKDITVYRRSAADDAEALRDAPDGEAVATDDPEGVRVVSYGGQNQKNEVMVSQLQSWFNQMAANPQGVGGQSLDADSATEAKILAGNASIGLEDMKDLVYQFGAEEARKRAWFLHTDPFIEIPLIRRDQVPAQYAMTPAGPIMTQGPQAFDQQVVLSPEARRGDWLDFTFSIQPESMGRVDARTRLSQALDFAVKVLPAAVQAAQSMLMIGVPFDVKAYVVKMAKDVGIDWMDEVFYDPEFQMRWMQMMMQGPSPQSSKGTAGGGKGGGGQQNGALAAILQNGQPGNVAKGAPSPAMADRQDAQAGANQGQAELRGMGGYV